MSDVRFDGRVALVTGAGGGIGRAHAKTLAARGAKVVVNDYGVSIRNEVQSGDRAQAVVDEITAANGVAVANRGSVASQEDVAAMVQQAIDTFGRIDIVVNNAGINASDPIQEEPGPAYAAHMAVHLEGQLMTMRAAWPHMARQGYGRFVNTSSAAALGFVQPDGTWYGSYAIAKAGVLAATRQAAGAGAPLGIKANAILPLAISRMVTPLIPGTNVLEYMERFTTAEHVALGACLLAAQECPVSGQAFSISGGRVARVFFASPLGFADPELTPEKVRDNWELVVGSQNADHLLEETYEAVDNAFEYALLQKAGIGAEAKL
ncbi:putative oxidoreductase [Frankia canadensis]|uniref:Putative oxidoreductase n=1 Tax=Frankia canadensis TaxID=1836972 RepID=A0A2I2KIF2_9ACTN|nr:SDR family NAD(P)-dependent oxidoreductase [Frankia canadensis]SNQ45409.1 putative oxidoreductase [Frankia canadensis]SOU52699.1 putative oxidoreductase [Frankia canadensis]